MTGKSLLYKSRSIVTDMLQLGGTAPLGSVSIIKSVFLSRNQNAEKD